MVRGEPTTAEVAAIIAVLRAARRQEAEHTSAWQRAALREGLGAAPACSPADLD